MPFIKDEGGVDVLLESLPVALKSGHTRLGIVMDADSSSSDRWSQAKNRFKEAGVELPECPDPSGFVCDLGERGGPSRVGLWLWLMPNNDHPGTLEDFLAYLVPAGDPVWAHAKTCTEQAIQMGALLGPGQCSKGTIHTYLAWQARPGMPFGQALTATVLEHDGDVAKKFVAWYRELFEVP